MPGDDARTNWMNLKTLGVAGIMVGVLGAAWNLLSIAGVSIAFYQYRERSQDRAAVAQADRADQARRADRARAGAGATTVPATLPATLIVVPVPPVPATVTTGVGLTVVIFILNTALAFVLLAASGILSRRPERAGPLLRLYATLKPPAVVLAGVAWWWLLRLAFDRTAVAHVALAVAVVALGCAYPILLGALLRRPGFTDVSTKPAPRGRR